MLGKRTGAPEVESPAQTYDQEVIRLKNWISKRLAWLDNNMVGSSERCTTRSEQIVDARKFVMFPNPASERIYFESNIEIVNVKIFDSSGLLQIQESGRNCNSVKLNIQKLKAGLYISKTTFANGKTETNKLMIR